jgi:DNA-binding transcriptional ArsR family regulator
MAGRQTVTCMLTTLGVETRVRILQMLKNRVLCVGALCAGLNVTQGAVSQHLRVLREAGLVVADKRGYYVHYRLNERTLHAWRKAIDDLLEPDSPDGRRERKRK